MLLSLGLFYASSSCAHMLNMTRIQVTLDETDSVRLELSIDLGQSLLEPAAYWELSQSSAEQQRQQLAPIADYLRDNLWITVNGINGALNLRGWTLSAESLAAIENPLTPQMAQFRFDVGLPDIQPTQTLTAGITPQLEVPWPLLVRVDSAAQALPLSRLLTTYDRSTRKISLQGPDSKPSWLDRAGSTLLEMLPGLTWVAVGFQHIVPLGLDHIVFVLGLFFLAAGTRPLVWQVTAFTVAHSITLALASLGYISVPGAVVEPLIAASIVYIAIDNLYARHVSRVRFGMVCIFGLLHGLGFAGVLSDLNLPSEQFLSSLLAFNLGVELGQLAVLALAFACVGWFRNKQWYDLGIAQPATLAIAGLGVYWLLHRTIV